MRPRWFALLLCMFMLGAAGCQKDDGASDSAGNAVNDAVAVAEMVGDPITLDAMPLAELLARPEAMLNQVVMIEGTVTGRCQGSGCWVSIDTGDPEQPFYAKSHDESFIFPEDCVGKTVRIQGDIMVFETEDSHDHAEGEEAHECPAPIYFLNPAGVEVLR